MGAEWGERPVWKRRTIDLAVCWLLGAAVAGTLIVAALR